MPLSSLTVPQLRDRLRGEGLALRIGPFHARLRTTLDELAPRLHTLYHDYPLAPAEDVFDFDVCVDCTSWLRSWYRPKARFRIDGEQLFTPFKRPLALAMLEWALNWHIFTRPQHYLILHTAVVERNGRALLLPGPPGAGKSTLCAALMYRGWRLLSDEVALITPHTDRITAAPLPVGLKNESIPVVRRFEPAAAIGPTIEGTRKGDVAHLRPTRESLDRVDEPARFTWVVFPQYRADAATELIPLPRPEVLMRVADDAFNYSVQGRAGFETLTDLIGASDAYQLVYGDLDEAVATLSGLPVPATGVEVGAPS
jgi:HprK-related kinase A